MRIRVYLRDRQAECINIIQLCIENVKRILLLLLLKSHMFIKSISNFKTEILFILYFSISLFCLFYNKKYSQISQVFV